MNLLLSLLQKILIGGFLLVVLALAAIALFKKLLPESGHETVSWQQVKHEDTLEAYMEYLRECPSCRHAADATARLDELQKKSGLVAHLDRGDLSVRDDFSALAFSPNGATIVAAGVNRLHFWESAGGKTLPVQDQSFRLAAGRRTVSIRYSLGGKQIAAGTSTRTGQGSLMVWDASSGTLVAEHPVQDHDIKMVAFAPKSVGIGWLADGPFGVWEPRANRILRATHEGAVALSFVRDDAGQLRLITVGGRDIWLWNPETLESLAKMELKTEKSLFGLSHDGRVVVYHDVHGVEAWNPLKGTLLTNLIRLDSDLTAFCSDTRRERLVFGTRNGMIHWWDRRTNTALTHVLAHRNAVEELVCSSRGRVVSRAMDGIKLWNPDMAASGQATTSPPETDGLNR